MPLSINIFAISSSVCGLWTVNPLELAHWAKGFAVNAWPLPVGLSGFEIMQTKSTSDDSLKASIAAWETNEEEAIQTFNFKS